MTKNVAILIPTMNRAEFVIRQLRYYALVRSPHPVYIGDASDSAQQSLIINAVEKLQANLQISYHHWPGLNDRQTISKLGEIAQEPFCAFVGDDDFLVPNSLSKCAEFLRRNDDYRTAQGKAILFSTNKPYGKIEGFGTYWQKKEALEDSSSERLINFGNNYWVPQFSVHRTGEFRIDSEKYRSMPNRSFGELLHSFMFIAQGRSRFIDCLYLVRQTHENQYALPDMYDWMTEDDWLQSYRIFHDTLAGVLIKKDGLSLSEAAEVIKRAFWGYLSPSFRKKYLTKYQTVDCEPARHSFVKELMKRAPGMSALIAFLKKNKLILSGIPELSILGLCDVKSAYHADFMPIYDTLVGPSRSRG
jgi:glycosyltransferase domain-containing protein